MTIRQLARALKAIKEELQDKEVVIANKFDELYSPEIKFILKDKFNMDKTKENVEKIILTW